MDRFGDSSFEDDYPSKDDAEAFNEWADYLEGDPDDTSERQGADPYGMMDAYSSDLGMTDLGLVESLEMEDGY